MKNLLSVLAILMLLPACALSSKKPSDVDPEMAELRQNPAMQIFLRACVSSRAEPRGVEQQTVKMGFTRTKKNDSEYYLRGYQGKVWNMKNKEGKFGVSLLKSGLCNVFVHDGDAETIQKSMEAWLPPAKLGFTHQKKQVAKNGFLTTTSYQIFYKGSLSQHWVITTSSEDDADLVALITYNGSSDAAQQKRRKAPIAYKSSFNFSK